jgi:aryl-alcohol dehydrogenase-like predicted oxidoreductase
MTAKDIHTHTMGIGTWAWGDRLFWSLGAPAYSMDDMRAAYQISVDAGVRLFDTAEVYGGGNSERILGELSSGGPADLYIASKCFPYPWRLFPKGSLPAAARDSLKRLQRPSIDLYQMHWPTPPASPEGWMHAMADAKEAGLINQIGVSNYGPRNLERAFRALDKRGHHLASNQIHYSLLQRSPERSGLIQLCMDLGVAVIAYSPLAQGLLTGKYRPDNPPGGVRGLRFGLRQLQHASELSEAMRKIGENYGGKTPAQVAINWCIAKGSIPIPGAKNARQAQDNVGAMGWLMSDDDMAELDELSHHP